MFLDSLYGSYPDEYLNINSHNTTNLFDNVKILLMYGREKETPIFKKCTKVIVLDKSMTLYKEHSIICTIWDFLRAPKVYRKP